VKYRVAGNRYGFALGEHDRNHAVVIDPLLRYTYVGGGANDFLWGLAANADGDIYASGYTSSANFPGTAGGTQPAIAAGTDSFIARYSTPT
jgi:hypothetical protein